MNKPSVFVAMPNMGTLAVGHTQNLLQWYLSDKYRMTWMPVTGKAPHDRARNECHRLFMESRCDYLFFMDADTVPPVDVLDQLLAANKDMISATVQTIQRHKGKPILIPVSMRFDDSDPEDVGMKPNFGGKGIVEVDMTTLACTLIKHKVMKAVGPRAFQFVYNDEYGTDGMSEDFFFNARVKEAGFKIWNHYGILCSHTKECDMKMINEMLSLAFADGQKG